MYMPGMLTSAILLRLWHSSRRIIICQTFSTNVNKYKKSVKAQSTTSFEVKDSSDTILKKKWTWSRLKTLRQWNEDTFYVFGPKLRPSIHRVSNVNSSESRKTRNESDTKLNTIKEYVISNVSGKESTKTTHSSKSGADANEPFHQKFSVSTDDVSIVNSIMNNGDNNSELNTECENLVNLSINRLMTRTHSHSPNAKSSANQTVNSTKEQSYKFSRIDSNISGSQPGADALVKAQSHLNQSYTKTLTSRNDDRMDYEDVSSSDDESCQVLKSGSINHTSSLAAEKTVGNCDNKNVGEIGRVNPDKIGGGMNKNPEDDLLKAFLAAILHYPLFNSSNSNETFEDKLLTQQSLLPAQLQQQSSVQLRAASGGLHAVSGIRDIILNEGEVGQLPPVPLPPLVSSHCPSVSTILSTTMPPENRLALERWERQMIEELGEEGFAQHKKETLQIGSNLHASVQRHLDGQPIDLDVRNEGHWSSIQKCLSRVEETECQEFGVRHSILNYRGILDCVAVYGGVRSLIEWKTSKKARKDIRHTYDNPLQLAAYLGAYNFCPTNKQIQQCVLVISHEDGSQADVHIIPQADCVRHWRHWLRRLHSYWVQRTSIS